MADRCTDLVSVVVPVYRPRRDHFQECLESILRQKEVAMEVIVSDNDPAHGEARRIVEGAGDARVHYVAFGERQGIFPNLNHGLQLASGSFIQIFCQDDRMRPGLLSAQVAGLKRYPAAGFSYNHCHVIDEEGRLIEEGSDEGAGRPYRYFPAERVRANLFKYGSLPGNLSPVMVRRSLIERAGYFDEGYRYAGDFEYWVRATKVGGMVISTEPLVELRRHQGQASRTLGSHLWLLEAAPIYGGLYAQLPEELRRWRTRMYANEHFGQQAFRSLVRQALRDGDLTLLRHLKALNRTPFNLAAILVMTLLSLAGKVQWFKLPEVDFFAHHPEEEPEAETSKQIV